MNALATEPLAKVDGPRRGSVAHWTVAPTRGWLPPKEAQKKMGSGYGSGVVRGAIGGTLAALTGCGAAQMAAPTDFDPGKVEFETDGRDGEPSEGEDARFAFGPYQVEGVKRNLSFKGGFDDFEGFEPAKMRGYRFEVAGGGKSKLSGECAEAAPQTTEELDGSLTPTEDDASLACTCAASGIPVTQLFVEDLAGQYTGPFSAGGVGARAVAVYQLDDGERLVGRPAGFRVEDEKGTVAAASVLPGEASVWLREGIEEPERGQIVCGLVGLMLWVPPAWPEPKEQESEEE